MNSLSVKWRNWSEACQIVCQVIWFAAKMQCHHIHCFPCHLRSWKPWSHEWATEPLWLRWSAVAKDSTNKASRILMFTDRSGTWTSAVFITCAFVTAWIWNLSNACLAFATALFPELSKNSTYVCTLTYFDLLCETQVSSNFQQNVSYVAK